MTAWIFYYALPVVLFVRFLLGTLAGVFLLSLALYWLWWITGDSKPFTPSQLVLWVDALPTDSKTAVFTSVLTVLGFLVAFYTATMNWKAEALAHLKVHVADEIELFFNEASRLTTDAEIYVRSLIDAVNLVHKAGTTPESIFNVQFALTATPTFLAKRDRLSAMAAEVHRIAGHHSSVLSSVWGATKALDDCATAFAEITQLMWVRIPTAQQNLPAPLAHFVGQVNVTECSSFIACCERNFGFINATTGAIRGLLLAPLVGANFSSIFSLYGKRATLIEALEKVRRAKSNGG